MVFDDKENHSTMRYSSITLIFLYLALWGELAKAQEADSLHLAVTVEQSKAYIPLYVGEVIIYPHEEPGSVSGDFKRALHSQSLSEAREKWEAFLKLHDSGEYEDAFHARHVRHAKFELMRVLYMLGETDQADKIILEMTAQ